MGGPTVRPARGRTPQATGSAGPVTIRLLAGLAAMLLCACQQPNPARSAAEAFIDRYYVEIDLPATREYVTGFARQKLDREAELLAGVAAPEAGGKPQVNYRFLREQPGSDAEHHGFLYELTITLAGGDQVVRRTLITVRKEDGNWRVANFEELD